MSGESGKILRPTFRENTEVVDGVKAFFARIPTEFKHGQELPKHSDIVQVWVIQSEQHWKHAQMNKKTLSEFLDREAEFYITTFRLSQPKPLIIEVLKSLLTPILIVK